MSARDGGFSRAELLNPHATIAARAANLLPTRAHAQRRAIARIAVLLYDGAGTTTTRNGDISRAAKCSRRSVIRGKHRAAFRALVHTAFFSEKLEKTLPPAPPPDLTTSPFDAPATPPEEDEHAKAMRDFIQVGRNMGRPDPPGLATPPAPRPAAPPATPRPDPKPAAPKRRIACSGVWRRSPTTYTTRPGPLAHLVFTLRSAVKSYRVVLSRLQRSVTILRKNSSLLPQLAPFQIPGHPQFALWAALEAPS